MVEMKNPIKEADAHPEIRHLSLWRTELAYAWVINCQPGIQDDMHYHENDDHIFMVLEGEYTVRTPHKEFVLKQHDTVMLQSSGRINCVTPAREDCCYSELGTPERMVCHEAEYQAWRVIRRYRNR